MKHTINVRKTLEWQAAHHAPKINTITCGDCLEVMQGIPDKSVDLVCIDPPYLTTNEQWDKKEVVNETLVKSLFRVIKEHGSLYVWCGIGENSNSLMRWFPLFDKYWHFKDLITWKKQRGIGMRKGWLYVREECLWFVKNNHEFTWNKEEQYDRTDKRLFSLPNNKSDYKRWTNVWVDIKEMAGGMKSNPYGHFCAKPVDLIERIIMAHTKENDVVLDCFLGSGTTAIACINTGRNFIGIEKEEKYCRIAEERIRALKSPVQNTKETRHTAMLNIFFTF